MKYIEPMIWAALAVYIFVLPIDGTIALRNVAFLMLVALTAWQAAQQRVRLDFPLLWPWVLYLSIACASLFYATEIRYSLHEIRTEIVYCILILVIAASWIRDENRFERLVWLLAAGNLLFVTGSAWTACRSGGINGSGSGAWVTGVGDTATTIITSFPWLVILTLRSVALGRRKSAYALTLLLIGNLAALFLTMNRQGWVALATSLAIMGMLAGRTFWTSRRIASIAVIAATLFAVFVIQIQSRVLGSIDPASTGIGESAQAVEQDVRWDLWQFSLAHIVERPWSGGGFGREAFKLQFPEYYREHAHLWHAHNMVLNKGIQMGMPGILAFLLLWLALARVSARGLREPTLRPWAIALLAMMAGVFMRNMTDDFFSRDDALLFWLMSGAFLGTLRQKRKEVILPSAVSAVPRILVIRRDNIGDLLCTTPLLTALRQAWPQGWIGVLANRYNAPILAGNPDIDAVFSYEKAKHRGANISRLAVWRGTARLLWRLRCMQLDFVLCASPGARRFARLIAPRRILEIDRSTDVGHETQTTFLLLKSLGIEANPGPLVLRADPSHQKELRARIGLNESVGRVLGVHISARKPRQRWPVERFGALLQELLAAGMAERVLLFWAPGEENDPQHPGDDRKAEQLLDELAGLPVTPVPTHELSELVTGLSLADSVICSDGGAMHIAAALGKPIVCFFGNSAAAHWHPWGVPYELLQPPSRNVADISVEDVVAAMRRLRVDTANGRP